MSFNSENFNLENWKITLPVDSGGGTGGTAQEIANLGGYASPYFYTGDDGAMVFDVAVDGATTKGSHYPRSELREMLAAPEQRGGGDASERAAWHLSEGGTLSATLKVNEVPSRDDGDPGREVIGQIHGKSDELVRLYYEGGHVYFMNDLAGPHNQEEKFTLHDGSGAEPSISLGEMFSYLIDAHEDTLTVKVRADGHVYESVTRINDVWQGDSLYFKAGLYLGVNETTGSGSGQDSFYGLDFSHVVGKGLGGWLVAPKQSEGGGVEALRGDGSGDVAPPVASGDTLQGSGVLRGGDGAARILGGAGDDTLIGGGGADVLTGGAGLDTFVFKSAGDGPDTITDFHHAEGDFLDISQLADASLPGVDADSFFSQGYLLVHDVNASLHEVLIDVDGSAGSAHPVLLAVVHGDMAPSDIGF